MSNSVDSKLWRDAANQFRRLRKRAGKKGCKLRAEWSSRALDAISDLSIPAGMSSRASGPRWTLEDGTEGIKSEFRAIARRAGAAMTVADGTDAWIEWLEALRRHAA